MFGKLPPTHCIAFVILAWVAIGGFKVVGTGVCHRTGEVWEGTVCTHGPRTVGGSVKERKGLCGSYRMLLA